MRKFFGYIWTGLDGLRRVLHLLLLLLIFGFIVGGLSGSIPKIPKKAALVVAPAGEIVEQRSDDPIDLAVAEARGEGQNETLLRDLVEALHVAKADARIAAVMLDLDGMSGAGQPTLDEFARAIDDFRKSGKKVVAFATAYSRDTYFVAAHADEIHLEPLGLVALEGYDRYRNYFKEALDKLGVDINVFRVGVFKSAVEPYIRKDMSPEDREASQVFINSLWDSYVKSVAAARKLTPEALASYVATLSPAVQAAKGDAAKVALDAKLVTALSSSSDVERRMIALVGEDEEGDSYAGVTIKDYLRVAHAEDRLKKAKGPQVGIIVASGEIVDGDGAAGSIGGKSMVKMIREARLDDDVKALVLRIDSPGGSVLASEEIYRELLAFKETKRPIVVSMGDLAASGGYYIAMPADEIWASPATITGSIGIFGLIPTINRGLDKIGVGTDGVGTTPLSGTRLDRPLSPAISTLIQATVERGYEEFLAHVSKGRNKTRDQVHAIAQGRVWSGRDALRIGLVDQLGSLDQAVAAAAKRAKLVEGKYTVRYREPDLSWAQEFAQSIKASTIATALRYGGIGDPQLLQALQFTQRQLGPVEREVMRFDRHALPGRLYAHCFCSAH
ncbi:MAG: hypothetical protein RL603_297 [Pseudomonadota bacterium]